MVSSKRRPASTQAVSRKVEGIEPRKQVTGKDDAVNPAEVNTSTTGRARGVQLPRARILGAIYEEDFIEGSYGFRPGRSCHDALRALSQTVEWEGPNHIAEADTD